LLVPADENCTSIKLRDDRPCILRIFIPWFVFYEGPGDPLQRSSPCHDIRIMKDLLHCVLGLANSPRT
ncbi:hypothetical protein PENTCL1PPCAC_3680, partial [Pristionchus entomophagus]